MVTSSKKTHIDIEVWPSWPWDSACDLEIKPPRRSWCCAFSCSKLPHIFGDEDKLVDVLFC